MDEVHMRFLAQPGSAIAAVANSLYCALDGAELVRISLNIDEQHLGHNLVEVDLGVACMIASIADEVTYAILFLASDKSSYIKIHMDDGAIAI